MSSHSRTSTNKIIALIEQDFGKFSELMTCFFDREYRMCQRAAWPVGDLGVKHPELLQPYMSELIHNLKSAKHDAIIRNTIRTWQFMNIPEDYQGEIFDICFNYINDPKIPIAIRVFSMTVCANISKELPELKEELALAIEAHLEYGSAGFKSRGLKTLKALRKQNSKVI